MGVDVTIPDQTIKDGIAIVTGAAGGLGRALCLALASKGTRVAAFGRDRAALAAIVDTAAPDRVLPFIVDVADPAAVAAAVGSVTDNHGSPTALVNNAAVYPRRDILDETPDSFMHTVAINLGGAVNCCHAVLPHMVTQGTGRIVNVVSFADLAPAPTAAAYSVSKGAQRILTRALVADLGDRFPGIVITDWIPGALKTRMGIPDGIDPCVAAEWGACLVMMNDPSLNGRVFDRDREHLEPVSFKRRLFNRLLARARTPVILG